MFFFLCAEEAFHLIVVLFEGKTGRRETEKGEKTETPFKGVWSEEALKPDVAWPLLSFGVAAALVLRVCGSPQGLGAAAPRAPLDYIKYEGQSMQTAHAIAIVAVTPGESDLPAN